VFDSYCLHQDSGYRSGALHMNLYYHTYIVQFRKYFDDKIQGLGNINNHQNYCNISLDPLYRLLFDLHKLLSRHSRLRKARRSSQTRAATLFFSGAQ
jgi:hypothetical protein